MSTGRHLGRGCEVLPPTPIAVYKQTIPALKNRVPEPACRRIHWLQLTD